MMAAEIHEANGVRFKAENDMIVRWCRAEHKAFEPTTTAWLVRQLQERDGVFIDVGAGTGWFSLLAANMGKDVWAFEPNNAVFRRLNENCALNGLRVRAHRAALSDRDGTATFYLNPAVPLTSGGSIECATCNSPISYSVRRLKLASALPAGVKVGVMKVDVEGHEIAVLDGAQEIITTDRPAMVLEANTERHASAIRAWVNRFGYTVTPADDRNLLCSP